jgi:hypothetical protein
VNPNWSRSTFKAVSDFRDNAQKPNSPQFRIPTAVNAAKQALDILNVIQKRHPEAGAFQSPKDFEAAMGKDPLWSRFKLMWTRYNEDVDVIARGSASVSMTEQAIQTVPQFPYLGSLAAYRSAIAGDMDQVASKTKTIHQIWDRYQTRDPMPGEDKQAESDMDAISRVNPMLGLRPNETTKDKSGKTWRWLGTDPLNPTDAANWAIVE